MASEILFFDAARNNDIKSIIESLSQGHHPDIRDCTDNTPFICACAKGSLAAAKVTFSCKSRY